MKEGDLPCARNVTMKGKLLLQRGEDGVENALLWSENSKDPFKYLLPQKRGRAHTTNTCTGRFKRAIHSTTNQNPLRLSAAGSIRSKPCLITCYV